MSAILRHLAHTLVNAVALTPLLLFWNVRLKRRSNRRSIEDPHFYLKLLELIKSSTGPADVLTRWRDVYEAPAASMNAQNTGEVTSFVDHRGAIYKFKLGDGVFVNMYFTRAGFRRSGDLHDCAQYDVVLKGRTRLRLIDPLTGQEHVREYQANDFMIIPARTPHMFEFLEDNYLLEWWESDFKAWYYKPYRSIIERGVPLADTEHTDFSIDIASQLQLPMTPLVAAT